MAQDRMLYWKQDGKKPTREDIQCLLEDFANGVGTITTVDDQWYWSLPGTSSFHLKRLVDADIAQTRKVALRDRRWIEVYVDETHGDVMTRNQDAFTSALADGLAATITLHWDADYEP